MKTVLHVIDTTGPGGAETVFVALAAGLDATEYRSLALIRGSGWVQTSLQAQGVKTFVLDCKGSFNVRYLRELMALIRRERIDVIQSHLLGSNVYCALAGFILRRPVIATFHGGVDVAAGERFLAAKFALLRLGANKIVAVSRALAAELGLRSPLPAERTVVIYNGIHTRGFEGPPSTRLRRQLELPEKTVLIGALGNIRVAKDYPLLLEAFSKVAVEAPDACLVIAGQGKGRLMTELNDQRDRLGLADRVHFLGFTDDPAEYLHNLDIFVLSSSTEGFSIATIQAMAAGVPLVATRCGGPEEIVSAGQDGMLVPPADADALASALLALIHAPEDSRRMASVAKSMVRKRFDIASMVAEYQALYRQCL